VFLDGIGRCALQKASLGEGWGPFALKPFYCTAYPVTIEHSELKIAEEDFLNRLECCRPVPDGTKSVLEVCHEELVYMLGEEGAKELKEIIEAETGQKH
jgi:hypothetical protein